MKTCIGLKNRIRRRCGLPRIAAPISTVVIKGGDDNKQELE
ncbi:MAG: hypothetical protein SVZ03_05215 [Spirochaetota bacterium]|nr:hypothetical protein [Spirochaetota bacterium]